MEIMVYLLLWVMQDLYGWGTPCPTIGVVIRTQREQSAKPTVDGRNPALCP